MSTKDLTLSCSCGAATHTFAVPLSLPPTPSRRISGSLVTSYININITHSPARKPDTSGLTSYDSSMTLRRWFCKTCGTHMYLEDQSDGHFEAATGTVRGERSDGVVEFEGMMRIGDTNRGWWGA